MRSIEIYDVTGDMIYGPVLVADSFLSKLRGFMFRRKPTEEAILLCNCSSVHTFWMNFNLDMVFMDRHGVVLRVDRSVSSREVITCPGAFYILECASGLLPLDRFSIDKRINI